MMGQHHMQQEKWLFIFAKGFILKTFYSLFKLQKSN